MVVVLFSYLFRTIYRPFGPTVFCVFQSCSSDLSSENNLLLFLLSLIWFLKTASSSVCNLVALHRYMIGDEYQKPCEVLGLNAMLPLRCSSTWTESQVQWLLQCAAGAQMMQPTFYSARCTTTPFPAISAVTSFTIVWMLSWRRWSPIRTRTRLYERWGTFHSCRWVLPYKYEQPHSRTTNAR